MALGSSRSNTRPFCPHQLGAIHGQKSGQAVHLQIEWLVDTGADIASIRHGVGSLFSVTTVHGLSASPTTGGGGILVVAGLDVEFVVEDVNGNSHNVRSSRHVGIKSSNAGSDVLGMAQVADVNAEMNWNPSSQNGSLQK